MRRLAALEAVRAWIESSIAALEAEAVPAEQACGRRLWCDLHAAADLPASDEAAVDGFAVDSSLTVGAGSYAPVTLTLVGTASPLPDAAWPVRRGGPMPNGTDAVVPLNRVEDAVTGLIALVEPLAPGANVRRRGAELRRGERMLPAGRRLGAEDVGLLVSAGFAEIEVARRPRIGVLRLDGAAGGTPVAEPMLRCLMERDGGVVAWSRDAAEPLTSARSAALDGKVDLLLCVAGGELAAAARAAAALAADGGALVAEGVALSPGEAACVGTLASGTPFVVLPETPVDCFWAYELIAGGIVRRLGGGGAELPFDSSEAVLARKIVSRLGRTEVVPVVWKAAGIAEPVAAFAEAGLAAVSRADGFVLVPENGEGYPEGAAVAVHRLRGGGPQRQGPPGRKGP